MPRTCAPPWSTEPYSVNLRRGGQSRLVAHTDDSGSQIAEWCFLSRAPVPSRILSFSDNRQKRGKPKKKIFHVNFPCKIANHIFPRFFWGSYYFPEGPPWTPPLCATQGRLPSTSHFRMLPHIGFSRPTSPAVLKFIPGPYLSTWQLILEGQGAL